MTLNLTGLCAENFFRPFFECPENFFDLPPPPTSPTFLGEIVPKQIILLQGIIGFRRAILADTPLIKRG
jgi:hypothetical protein